MTDTFRDSEFINFNTGIVKIDPMLLVKLSPPVSFEQKVRLFHCRVDVWTLGIAVEILKQIESSERTSIWSHATYGLLGIGFSYFEMIGKTLNLESSGKSGTASQDFNWGFCDVYPEFKSESGSYKNSDMPIVKEFCNRVRNGIYHLGYTKRRLSIHNNPIISGKDFDVVSRSEGSNATEIYCVNPRSMTRTIVAHFPGFIERLYDSDTKDDKMRRKFLEFYDEFHDM